MLSKSTLLFFLVLISIAVGNPIDITTNGLQLSMTNDKPPKYSFSLVKQGSPTYQVFMHQIYEVTSSKNGWQKVPKSELSLAQFDWEFSNVTVTQGDNANATTWTFSMTTKSDPQRFNFIEFNNHITGNYSTQLKFDLIVDDYKWVSKDPNASLAFWFQVNSPGNGNVNGTKYSQGALSFDLGTQAPDPDSNGTLVNVSLSVGDGHNSFVLVYSHFIDHLSHDPIIAIGSSSPSKGMSGGKVFGIIVLVALLIVCSYFIIGIIINMAFFQKNGAQAIPHYGLFAKLFGAESSQYEQIPNQNA